MKKLAELKPGDRFMYGGVEWVDVYKRQGVLRLDAMTNGDMRLQIPYTGNADVFDVRKEICLLYTSLPWSLFWYNRT